MTRKEKISKAKELYDIELSKLQNNAERWKEFLDFSSNFYKYSFIENILMFTQRPDVTMCATIEQWNSVGRWVNKGAKGIRLIDNQTDEIALKYVFDVKDTHGDAKVIFRKWSAEENQIIDILKDYFNYNNYNSLKEIVSMYVYEHFDTNKIVKGLSDEEKEQLTPTFIEDTINSVTYCVAKRSNININENELLENLSSISNNLQLRMIGSIVNDFSNDILRIVEYKIRQRNKEVNNYAKTRKIWSENQEQYGGELSVQISRVSDGRDNNGQTIGEGTRDNSEKTSNRERVEREISETSNKRISSDSEIQSDDRGNDRGIITTRDRGEDLGVEQNSTSFNLEENNVAEEYITEVLKSGGNIVNAIDYIKDILKDETLSKKEKSKEIKKWYEWTGTGFPDEYRADATSKGIWIKDNVNKAEITISWLSVVERLEQIYEIRDTQLDLFNTDYTTMQDKEDIYANDDVIIEDNEQNNIVEYQIQEQQQEKRNYRIPNDFTKQYNLKTKYKENIQAIKLLKELEENDRMATSEEQTILAKYNGWGGLAKVFDGNATEWTAEYKELQEILTDDEYERARSTVLDSFYTDKDIIKAMYDGLERLGFKKGNILEPSAGIGNFIGNIPENMIDSKFTAIEIDDLTGRILKQLYQKEQVYIQGYENTDLQDNFYDVAISNVPFGNIGISDKRYNKENLRIHDYFFAKSIDKVRNGGIIAFITSSNTMDKTNYTAREYIAKRAKLLGAIRLPTNAFRTVANTDVTTDIIFLQKRDKILEDERPSWVDVAQITDDIYINSYFKDNPDMVMGEFKEATNQFNKKIYDVIYNKKTQNLKDMLENAINKLPENIYQEIERNENEIDEYILAPNDIKNNSYADINDKLYYKENSLMKLVDKKALTKERILGMIKIRDTLDKLIEIQGKDVSDEEIKPYQQKLNEEYDEFYKKYGAISSSANKSAFEEDVEYQLICALENINEETKEVTKTDIFYKRTIEPSKVIDSVETSDEALIVSLNQRGFIDFNLMSNLCNKDYQTLIEELNGKIYRNPLVEEKGIDRIDVGWETAEEYLSGDVVEKLAIAEAKAKDNDMYLQNVRALREVQPVPLKASDIEVKLRCNLDTNILYRTICKRKI